MGRNSMKMMKMIMAVLVIAGLIPLSGLASEGPGGRGRPKGPPPEAVEACKGKSEGTTVEFTSPRGEKIKATCKQFRGQLVAVPDNLPAPPDGPGKEDGSAGSSPSGNSY